MTHEWSADEPAVSVRDVAVRFGANVAVADLSFDIPEAAVLAVVGPNGAGKSTLVRVLLGLIEPDSGDVAVLGRRPRDVPAEWIGYVPQIKTLDRTFPGTGIELVTTGLRRGWPWRVTAVERKRARAALDVVDAGHLSDRLLGELSGGELQRVYLARAVARRPRLIVLDEPATGIDVVGEETIYRFVDQCRREVRSTVIMVTHDLAVAYHHATDVLLLNRTQRAFGFPDEVLSEANLHQAYGHQHDERGAAGHRHEHRHGQPHEEGADA